MWREWARTAALHLSFDTVWPRPPRLLYKKYIELMCKKMHANARIDHIGSDQFFQVLIRFDMKLKATTTGEVFFRLKLQEVEIRGHEFLLGRI
jgi:hypothetical protein